MTWNIAISGHGTPNDEANKKAERAVRAFLDELRADGQVVHLAEYQDNRGSFNLLIPPEPEGDGL